MIESWCCGRVLGRVCTAVLILAVGIVGSERASAGIVSFDSDLTVIDLAAGDDTVVTVGLTLNQLGRGELREIEAVVGSNDLNIMSFAFSSAMLTNPDDFYLRRPQAFGRYPSDVLVGFVSMVGERALLPTPLPLGTLTVDASGLVPGSYELVIDSAFERASLGSIRSATRPLLSRTTIQIVPEPATVVLLGVAGIALLPHRRRR